MVSMVSDWIPSSNLDFHDDSSEVSMTTAACNGFRKDEKKGLVLDCCFLVYNLRLPLTVFLSPASSYR